MSDSSPKTSLRLKDRLEVICAEMIEKGILYSEAVGQFERCFISEYLQRKDHSLIQASKGLGMHRNTLAKKIYEYKIKKIRTGG